MAGGAAEGQAALRLFENVTGATANQLGADWQKSRNQVYRCEKSAQTEETDTVELRHLRYMLAVAEHRNFTRASRAIHISQSTLSYQVRQLELEIGHDLFDRTGREVLLTSAGEILVKGVRRALDELNGAIRELKQDETGADRTINILVGTRGCSRRILACEVAEDSSLPPGLHPCIEEIPAAAMLRRLDEMGAAFDIVMGDVENLPPGWRFEPLYQEEVGLYVPPSHRFAHRKRVRMAELEGEPVVLVMPPEPTRLIFDASLRQAQVRPHIVAEFNQIEAMIEMTMLREAAAVAPRNPCAPLPILRYVGIDDPTPMRTVGFMWREDELETHIRRFADLLRKRVQRFAASNNHDFRICSWREKRPTAPNSESADAVGHPPEPLRA